MPLCDPVADYPAAVHAEVNAVTPQVENADETPPISADHAAAAPMPVRVVDSTIHCGRDNQSAYQLLTALTDPAEALRPIRLPQGLLRD